MMVSDIFDRARTFSLTLLAFFKILLRLYSLIEGNRKYYQFKHLIMPDITVSQFGEILIFHFLTFVPSAIKYFQLV